MTRKRARTRGPSRGREPRLASAAAADTVMAAATEPFRFSRMDPRGSGRQLGESNNKKLGNAMATGGVGGSDPGRLHLPRPVHRPRRDVRQDRGDTGSEHAAVAPAPGALAEPRPRLARRLLPAGPRLGQVLRGRRHPPQDRQDGGGRGIPAKQGFDLPRRQHPAGEAPAGPRAALTEQLAGAEKTPTSDGDDIRRPAVPRERAQNSKPRQSAIRSHRQQLRESGRTRSAGSNASELAAAGSPACVSSSAGFLRERKRRLIAGDEARRAPTYPADLRWCRLVDCRADAAHLQNS